DARNEIAIGDEAATLAFGAEAEILDLDDHGDGEAVIDRSIFDVGRGHARLGEGSGTGTAPSRDGDVDAAAILPHDRLAAPDWTDKRARQRPGDLLTRQHEGAAAIGDDAAIEAMQRVGDHRRG